MGQDICWGEGLGLCHHPRNFFPLILLLCSKWKHWKKYSESNWSMEPQIWHCCITQSSIWLHLYDVFPSKIPNCCSCADRRSGYPPDSAPVWCRSQFGVLGKCSQSLQFFFLHFNFSQQRTTRRKGTVFARGILLNCVCAVACDYKHQSSPRKQCRGYLGCARSNWVIVASCIAVSFSWVRGHCLVHAHVGYVSCGRGWISILLNKPDWLASLNSILPKVCNGKF